MDLTVPLWLIAAHWFLDWFCQSDWMALNKSRRWDKDFGGVAELLGLLRRPFDEQPDFERYAAPPPDWASSLSVSCSS